MNIDEAQQKALKLLRLAASAPDSEEGRTAACVACKIIVEHGLLVMKPADLLGGASTDHPLPTMDDVIEALRTPPVRSAPAVKRRPKRPTAKEIRETVTAAADTATTAIHAVSQVVSAVNGFRDIAREVLK